MTQHCHQCKIVFEIRDEDLKFYDKVSPVIAGKKYFIPPPIRCPDCRLQRRMSFYNLRNLYIRKCDRTGKKILSIYSPHKPFPVYDNSYWWSDKWDALSYGFEFNFEKPFFEQFSNLLKKIPRLNLMNDSSLLSKGGALNNDWHNSKNCYYCFSFSGESAQDCYYCSDFNSGNYVNCVDVEGGSNLERVYECLDCNNCYQCFYSQLCQNCSDCFFSYNLSNCQFCLFCSNLNNKEYHIFNKPVTPEEFNRKKKEILSGSYKKTLEVKEIYRQILSKIPRKAVNLINSDQCTEDNLLSNCKNIYRSFSYLNAQDSAYLFLGANAKDCHDVEFSGNTELVYEGSNVDGSYRISFTVSSWNSKNCFYIDNCHNCRNIFGCVGLKNKKYCILNKQYSRIEYERLIPKIIKHMRDFGEWGLFFPATLSPFGYNETVANNFFPLSKNEALKKAFNWYDYEPPPAEFEKTIPSESLPDDIKSIPDDIVHWSIQCEVSGKAFKIIPQELDFYRQNNLPLPRRHPDQRHSDRIELKNPYRFWQRECINCKKTIETTDCPGSPEQLYCESCYLKLVPKKNDPLYSGLDLKHAEKLRKVCNFAQVYLQNIQRSSGQSYAEYGYEVALTLRECLNDVSLISVAFLQNLLVHPDGPALLKQSPLNHEEQRLVKLIYDLRQQPIDLKTGDLDQIMDLYVQDGRIFPIMMAYRLNDIRHLDRFSPDLRLKMANETIYIYASIAERLGMLAWRHEMEDICFEVIHPKIIRNIRKKFEESKNLDKACLNYTSDFFKVKLKKQGIDCKTDQRIKTFYSTYRKMALRSLRFDELRDRLALRIIVKDIKDCYQTLGIVHALMRPIPGTFKDYIGTPKENNYQSIHTIIYPLAGVTEQPIEIQIRTEAMHMICEYGPAAHGDYKHNKYAMNSRHGRVNLFRNLQCLRQEARSPQQFKKVLRKYFDEDQIAIFDAKNNLHHLKKSSTALDFICQTYPKKFTKLKSVRINGRNQSLDTNLSDGDVVEALFARKSDLRKIAHHCVIHEKTGKIGML